MAAPAVPAWAAGIDRGHYVQQMYAAREWMLFVLGSVVTR